MLYPDAETAAYGAGLAGVRRIDKFNPDTLSFSLIGDKRLQLRPGPLVQPGTNTLASLDPFADVGQVLHGNCTTAVSECFCNNRLADLMVNMGDMAGFAAGDFPEQLPCRWRAVALKPSSEGKERVAFMPELAATEQLSGADGGDSILSEIHTGNKTGVSFGDFGKIEDQVEVKPALTADQFSFFGNTGVEKISLKRSRFHQDGDASLSGEEREDVPLDGIRPLVNVDGTGRLEGDGRPCTFPVLGMVRQQGCVRPGHGSHSITGHLGTKGGNGLSGTVVSQMVQLNPVLAVVFDSQGDQEIARTGELHLEQRELCTLLRRSRQFYADRTLHSMPSLDMLSPLDIVLDRFRNLASDFW